MAVGVVMPALEIAQDTGTLVSWFKEEGDRVTKGERLLQIETDKAVVEIEATGDGILAGVVAKAGDVIPVGRTIAWLVQPGETPPPAALVETASGSGFRRMSPKARRLAREHRVDLGAVHGSGPEGEILAQDVLAAADRSAKGAGTAAASPDVRFDVVSSVGRRMAERTTESWTTVPHFFVTRDVDAGPLSAARDRLIPEIEGSHGVRITHTDLLVSAVADTLRRHPRLNARWTKDGIVLNPDTSIALATAVENAVVTVVLRDVDSRKLGDIALRRHGLVTCARAGKLQPADVAGGTFTISNLGMLEVDAFTAIIVPPQAAILTVGAIVDRVVPVQGRVTIRPMVTLTLGCDHRVVDGARAAAFLRDLIARLSEPDAWHV